MWFSRFKSHTGVLQIPHRTGSFVQLLNVFFRTFCVGKLRHGLFQKTVCSDSCWNRTTHSSKALLPLYLRGDFCKGGGIFARIPTDRVSIYTKSIANTRTGAPQPPSKISLSYSSKVYRLIFFKHECVLPFHSKSVSPGIPLSFMEILFWKKSKNWPKIPYFI